MPFEIFKHCFFELTKVAFWDCQEVEYEFKVKCVPLKHRFIDFIQVAFWAGEEDENDLRPLESSLFRLHQIAFSDNPEAENKLRMLFETLKHRFSTSSKSYFGIVHTSKIGRVPCETLKHRFFDLTQVAFWVVKRPKMSSKDLRAFETSRSRLY